MPQDPYQEQVLAIGQRFGELRQQKKLTILEVTILTAERGHRIDPTALSKSERSKRRITLADFLVLADVLNVSSLAALLESRDDDA